MENGMTDSDRETVIVDRVETANRAIRKIMFSDGSAVLLTDAQISALRDRWFSPFRRSSDR